VDAHKLRRLAEFDTPTIANGLELVGGRDPSTGYTGPDVRALMPELGPRVGIAVTARMDTTSPGVEDRRSHPAAFYEWLRHIMRTAGSGTAGTAGTDGTGGVPVFAVIESVGPRPRSTVTIGDGMGTQLAMAGVAGFLTNGCIRDLEGVRAVPLACWAAGVSPMHGAIRWLDLNVPVVIDGMTVRPGDAVHADVNGALVLPPDAVEAVYEQATAVREKERLLFDTLRSDGMTLERYLASIGQGGSSTAPAGERRPPA
jgi:regulator of RNase E activity RraA